MRGLGVVVDEGIWIRMVGVLASLIGACYLLAARADLTEMYGWNVWGRIDAGVIMIYFFVSGT